MNNDLPPIDDLTEKEIKIDELNEKLNIVKGNIAIQIAIKKNVEELKQEEENIQGKISALLEPFKQRKEQAKEDFSSSTTNRTNAPHPCSISIEAARRNPNYYQELTIFQCHKYVSHYCMQRRKKEDGTEYGAPYYRFQFLMDLHARYQIKFEEREDGSVKVSFISIRNDPRMSQHYKFHLQS